MIAEWVISLSLWLQVLFLSLQVIGLIAGIALAVILSIKLWQWRK